MRYILLCSNKSPSWEIWEEVSIDKFKIVQSSYTSIFNKIIVTKSTLQQLSQHHEWIYTLYNNYEDLMRSNFQTFL